MRKAFLILTALLAIGQGVNAQTNSIQPGRAIEIRIQGVPPEEVSRVNGTYPVSESGFIRMPYIGNVRAAGSDPPSLSARIEGAYRSAKIYTNPTIQIIASSDDTVTENIVTVGGQVAAPGPVKYVPGLTIYNAIQAARGATPFGSMYRVKLIRNGKLREYDLTKTQAKGVQLQPNDTIEVPQKNLWGR